MLKIWLILGGGLMLAEFILPGLVVMFIGLGALTVAGLMHFGVIDGLTQQVLVWIGASVFYLFTLRLLIIRFYPTDTEVKIIDEDLVQKNKIVKVVEKISSDKPGRIAHGDTTWAARIDKEETLAVGDSAKIVGRDNITLVVEKTEPSKTGGN